MGWPCRAHGLLFPGPTPRAGTPTPGLHPRATRHPRPPLPQVRRPPPLPPCPAARGESSAVDGPARLTSSRLRGGLRRGRGQ